LSSSVFSPATSSFTRFPNRYHPRVEDAALQAGGDPRQLIEGCRQLAEGLRALFLEPRLLLDRGQLLLDRQPFGMAAGPAVSLPAHQVADRLGGGLRPADPARLAECRGEFAGQLREPGPVDDELAGEIEEHVEPIDADPHGLRQRRDRQRLTAGLVAAGVRCRRRGWCRGRNRRGGDGGADRSGAGVGGRRLDVKPFDAVDAGRFRDRGPVRRGDENDLDGRQARMLRERRTRRLAVADRAEGGQTGEEQFGLELRHREPRPQMHAEPPGQSLGRLRRCWHRRRLRGWYRSRIRRPDRSRSKWLSR